MSNQGLLSVLVTEVSAGRVHDIDDLQILRQATHV